MHRNNEHRYLLILLIGLCLVLAGCKVKATHTPNPTIEALPTATGVATPEITPTPTLAPLGSSSHPVVIGFISTNQDSSPDDNMAQLTHKLSDTTGYTLVSSNFPNYADLLTAFRKGSVHVAFLPPVTYLVAHQQGLVNILLVTNHFGRYAYGTQFLSHVASGFSPYFDVTTNQNTADAGSALAQFAGKRPCFTESTSVSGYLLPLGILASQNVATLAPVIAQSQEAVIRSLYIQQVCDFGATFALSGDPRTASGIQQSLPDVLSKVIVIWRSEAVIPSLNISVSIDMPLPVRQALNDALLALVKTPDGKKMLSSAADYDIQDLMSTGDDFYDPLRTYLKAASVDIEKLVGK